MNRIKLLFQIMLLHGLWWLTTVSSEAAPFLVADRNPLVVGTLDVLSDAPPPSNGASVFDFNLNVSNTLNRQGARGGDEFLLLDEETVDLELHWRRRFREQWLFGLSLPWISRGGGRLDRFLSEYHQTLGLPNGERPSQPDNRFLIQYDRKGETRLLLERPVSGFGDPSLLAGRITRDDANASRVWYARLRLPVGEDSQLLGAGQASLAGWLSTVWRPGNDWSWSTDVGALWQPGGRETPLGARRAGVAFGAAALTWRIRPAFRLSSQLDWRSRVFRDGRLKLLGSATLLTLGGQWRIYPGAWLVVAVTEDIQVSASPDVNLQVGLKLRPEQALWATGAIGR